MFFLQKEFLKCQLLKNKVAVDVAGVVWEREMSKARVQAISSFSRDALFRRYPGRWLSPLHQQLLNTVLETAMFWQEMKTPLLQKTFLSTFSSASAEVLLLLILASCYYCCCMVKLILTIIISIHAQVCMMRGWREKSKIGIMEKKMSFHRLDCQLTVKIKYAHSVLGLCRPLMEHKELNQH